MNASLLPWTKIPVSSNCLNICLVACGSYNPVHIQHLRNFEDARNFLEHSSSLLPNLGQGIVRVFQGILSPVHDEYSRLKPSLISGQHRVNMCMDAVDNSDWITVTDWETKQQGWMKTALVLQVYQTELRERHGTETLVKLLCGVDLLQSMLVPNLWSNEHIDIILGEIGLVVLPRPGFLLDELIDSNDILSKHKSNMILIQDNSLIAASTVSSTLIRKLVATNQSVRYLTEDKVIAYIKENKLYHAYLVM